MLRCLQIYYGCLDLNRIYNNSDISRLSGTSLGSPVLWNFVSYRFGFHRFYCTYVTRNGYTTPRGGVRRNEPKRSWENHFPKDYLIVISLLLLWIEILLFYYLIYILYFFISFYSSLKMFQLSICIYICFFFNQIMNQILKLY